MSYLDIFNQVVTQNSDKPAIVDTNGQRTVSYKQLDEMSGKIAAKLKSSGCKKGDAVIVRLGRKAEFIAAEIGIMKLGCVAVPTLPSYPQERVDYIAGDCGADIVIDDNFIEDIDTYQKAEPVESDDNDKVLIIYTSGSTGKPKGVVYSSKVFDAAVERLRTQLCDINPIVFAAVASMTFVVTVFEYFTVFSFGGCTHILSDDVRVDIEKLQDYYADNNITVGFLSPRVLKIYKNKDKELKVVITGSERLVDTCFDEFTVYNSYGQSETTCGVISFRVDKKYDNTPIGKPFPGVKVFILDNDGNEVANGEEGELCVQSVFTDEYLNLPEQSAKTFKKLPNGEVIVHTGDIVKKLPDGNIVYVNRKDWMVKINGQRVEPGEIEAVLKEIPDITNAAVKDFTTASGQVYLCGYYTSNNSVSSELIRQELGKNLPDYMIPSYFIRLDTMPTNINGKLDRAALMPPELADIKAEYAPPTNKTEELLCNAFEKILKCGKVGINDNFFMLGGDSIKVMQLQNECAVPGLSTKIIFKGKTPSDISKLVENSEEENYTVLSDYPITQTQYGIFIECSSNPDTTIYNIPSLFKLDDKVDVAKLKTAVENTINSHPYIKTKLFMNDRGEVRAKRNDNEKPLVEITECEKLPETSEFVKPYELLGTSLYRTRIYKTNDANYLFLDFHHIISDGTSMTVILEDINSFYDGKPVETEIYTGFEAALDEEKARKTNEYEKAKQYYDSVFSGCDTDFLPIKDKNDPAPSVGTYEYECKVSLDSIKKFCDDNNLTLNAFFNGVFGFVLSKYNYKDEALYTTVYNGRSDPRLERAVTMLVKTFPVLLNAGGEKKIFDLLTETKNQLMNNMSNDIYSFAEISRAYDIKADIMFVYQGEIFNCESLAGEKTDMQVLSPDTAKAPVTVHILNRNNKIVFKCVYRSDMYEQSTIIGMAQCFSTVSGEFLSKTYLKEVTLLSAESEKLLDKFNNTERDYEKTDIVTLFRRQAEQNPDNTAVVYLDKSYTYKEVDEISERIGAYISSLGIGREDVVSILIPRCEYMVLASVGVLKSGAAYQPLDPSYPQERLEFMMQDSDAKLLIAGKDLLERVPNYKGKVLLIEDIPALPPCEKIKENPNPQDLFIMLYTSGSTGTPKGCMLEHRNIVSFCNWYRNYYNLTPQSRVAAYASYGFDANMMDMYPALTTGAAVYIIDEAIRLDLVAIDKYFNENGITHSFMTTQVGRQFATEIDNCSITELSVGGEKLVPLNPPKNHKLINLYGPTESTVCITAFEIDKFYDRVPIGKALDNTKLYVVDKQGRRLPPCVPGELWVAGHGVSRGYLNRPEQNEKAFIENPFTDEKGYEKVYRTGDIVRFLPDGNIDFVGRNDAQVKIRGFRIELSEVEKIIREFEGIKDATVAAFDEPNGEKFIAAYVVSDEKVDIQKLNEFILANKPPYMVPAVIMQIDKIPLNQNQKVDKRALPKPEKKAQSDESSSKPMTLLEKKIHSIIAKIIGNDNFSVTENLLSAGMNSLSVIKLAVELHKEFGFEANVKQMMKECSVVSIEDRLQEYLMSGAFAKSTSEQKQKTYKSLYPLSKTQLGVYIDCMKNPYTTLYNIPTILKFTKSINANKLAESVKKVILAHPYIFTHLTTQNDDVEQVYPENRKIDIPVKKMTENELELLKKEYVKPFNFSKSPLFRILVVETESNIYLFTDFHHIIFDGASYNIFMNQLKAAYEGAEIKSEDYTYFDYIDDEIKAESSEEYIKAEKFFDDMMKNFESASEITPDSGSQGYNGRLAEVSVPFDLAKTEAFCNKNGVTPAQLFLAAAFYSVSRFTNSRNVYLSTISNGRSDMRLTDCFGMFVKTLPLGIEIEDISALEFVKKSKSVFTGAIENEIYPYSKICSKFGFAPNIMYEYQIGVTDDLKIDGETVERNFLEMKITKFKTAIYIENYKNQPCVVVRYNEALYSKELMQTLVKSIFNTAMHIISEPESDIRKISLLDDSQIDELNRFSFTSIAPVETKLLHKMFENQVEKTPDSNAITACDGTLTYRELNRRANVTANELIAKGLKKGGRVVVLLERTSKIFSTIFGVLKAGGAFIPTCPDYPQERINSIIEDSEADFVVTEGELVGIYDKTIDVDLLLGGENCETPDVDVSPEDLAYLIYTSGSTGKPKGVMLRHIGIANYISYSDVNPQVKYIVDNCKAYGSVTTVSFDMSLKETVLSLCNGLTLVFANDEQTVNPIALAKFLKENSVDAFNSTPSRLLQYMELDEFAEAIADCKVILSGGEKYPYKLLKLLREKTNAKILNTYGPTEITVSSNCKDLTNADEISVGKPLLNYVEHIVDADNNLLPVGVVGELLISGCGVALGYNKLVEQTKKAFVEFNGERTYRSGDYAKWTSDGDVIILGRTDNQVKLRGLRIELGEIEKCLSNINGIKNAVALIKKVNNADAICAYYTSDTQLDTEFVKNELKKSLTDYMVPTAYVQLSEMPLTPNGKVNTKLLPEPQSGEKKAGVKPTTALEKTMCDIFAKVLELDKVYADDNFFDIGGSSLTVTRVIILANKRGIEIAYGDVFENPTPAALAKLCEKYEVKNDFEDLSNYDYRNIENVLLKNNLESFKNGDMQEIGDVLLTGAAGFLGIHILYELLHRYSGKVYCLLRDKNNNPAEDRLNMIFFYYFEESLKEKYSDRLTVLSGDVTDRESFDKFLDFDIDTVINCAANVKHFSKGTDIEDVNLYGTLNVIDFCKQGDARLIHVSTMSVGGIFVSEQGEVTHLKENLLYFGQQATSKYTLSKFLAERAILEEVSKGFNAKIMRVGTLSARNSDGEYQINFTTNTFMGRLKSNIIIGKYPYDMIETPFELSPIDFVAKAILLLSKTPKNCTVFHPFNNHMLMMGDLYMEMDKIGLHSQASETEEYERALEEAKQNPEKAKILSSMLAYQNIAHGQKIFSVGKSNKYTMQVLYRMGFHWPVTSLDYMKRFINALRGLGFFDFN